MTGRVVCWRAVLSAAAGVMFLLGIGLPAAGAATAITLAASPTVVPNGGQVSLSGTAPCGRVRITASPGASGVAYVQTTVTVSNGHFFTHIQLPHFVPDPSRPGLFDTLAFHAFCRGTQSPEADSGVDVTGVELARTGSDIGYQVVAALLALLVGVLCATAQARGRRTGW